MSKSKFYFLWISYFWLFCSWITPSFGAGQSHHGVTLNYTIREVRSFGLVEVLRNRETHVVLGAGTRVCVTNHQEKDWLITPAHVSNHAARLVTLPSEPNSPGREFHKEASWDLMDLSLYSAPPSNAPCARLIPYLKLPLAYDAEAILTFSDSLLSIEAPEVDHWQVKNYELFTTLSGTFLEGLPGRDETGPLMTLVSKGFRGQSGGAILGVPNSDGEIDVNSAALYSATEAHGTLPPLAAMLLAVSPEGRITAALPAPTIFNQLNRFFAKLDLGNLDLAKSVPGGTEYLDSGAIHLRGPFSPAGFGEETKPEIKQTDTQLKVAGTGGMADGGNERGSALGFSPSGILLRGKRWLTLGDQWTEYEPAHQTIREMLRQPEMLSGIFSENGSLYATDSGVVFPNWLGTIEPDYDTEKKGDCLNTVALITSTDNSGWVMSNSYRNLSICEWETSAGRKMSIKSNWSDVDQIQDLPKIKFIVSLEREGYSGKNIKLSLKANLNGKTMKSDGLRRFYTDEVSMIFGQKTGYHIDILSHGKKYLIAGPMMFPRRYIKLGKRRDLVGRAFSLDE